MEELLIRWLHRSRFFTESLQLRPPSPVDLIRPALRDRDKPPRSRDSIPGGQYGGQRVEPNTALFNLVLKAMHGGKESEAANVEYNLEVEMASAASASSTGCLVRSRLPLGKCQHHHNNGIALLPQLPKPLISLSSSSKAAAIAIAIAIPTATASERKERSSFARTAAVRHLVGSGTTAHGLRFAVVVARFNEIVTKPLLEGALTTFNNYSVQEEDIDRRVIWRLQRIIIYQLHACVHWT